MFEASYIKLYKSGLLKKRADVLLSIYDECTLCPRMCRANRSKGEKGICSAGSVVKVCSAHAHFGEERPLVGRYGSGTIFLSFCNLLCIYCQNDDISHGGDGQEMSDKDLASLMLRLQKTGCHNINFVSPTHFLPNIVNALVHAVEMGLTVPLVYNTGGYDRVEILKLLDGIFDIYLPDYKYSDGVVAAKFSRGVKDYPEVAKAALKEMFRQVGVLKKDELDAAQQGLMIRHLVLPNNLAGTSEFVRFVAEELDQATYVIIMAQYRPCYQAHQFPELARPIHPQEYKDAINKAQSYNL
ncbi:MAG: radical SAM protein, partial [bacterium]|nr:radical SAM protein [bacterium]